MARPVVDRIGMTYGRLTVVALKLPRKPGNAVWICSCSCGKRKMASSGNLHAGTVKSCGCLKTDNSGPRRHLMSYSREYSIWANMLDRCRNKNNSGWKHYGGRGIKVCNRWLRFENFFSDMGAKPDGKSLERKNNNGHYSPRNCKWATAKEQRANQRPRSNYHNQYTVKNSSHEARRAEGGKKF